MNLAATALRIAGLLAEHDLLFLADDEQQAEGMTAGLRALRPDNSIIFVPSSDALPGDLAHASPANSGRRIAALRRLRDAQQRKSRPRLCLILSGEAAARRYPSPKVFGTAPPVLKPGDAIDPAALAPVLEELGYFPDDRIDEPGEMALRGDVIDLFPADAGTPARIEIHNGHIAAIRAYDPLTQRSIADLNLLEIGRAAEPAIDKAVSILAHMKPAIILISEKADVRRLRFIELARDAATRRGSIGDVDIDAITDDTWMAELAKWRRLEPSAEQDDVPKFAESRSPLAALAKFAGPLIDAGRSLVLAGSERDLRFLRPRVAKRLKIEISETASFADLESLPSSSVAAIEMPIDAGCVSERYLLVAAADLLGRRAVLDLELARPAVSWAEQATAFRTGDVVIHEDHGIALVAGLEPGPDSAAHDGDHAAEMIVLEYAGGARRLVAVDDAERIWRYGADTDAVTLDKLDGSSWQKRRSTIDQAVAESAKGLAALAQERAKLRSAVIEPDPAAYERFAGGFAFNETADQARAIAAVRDDLASGRPMDRLVVGDVGYGKTEVALRAAALAALAGYQVIVAAPTTVLVRQHLENFRKRCAGSDIKVEGLSRLSSAAEKKAVKAGLADGSVQIVVGTAAVMAKDVTYAKLALVVIDEEQRFGAADKARLRSTGEVHLLSLSATPIPRTLQMALVGLQQISIIATPPARRQPIRTSMDQYDDGRIRTALLREKSRGGQSFVVVPRIEDMAEVGEKLRRIAPELSLVEAHGKLPAADIDKVMVDFAEGRGDVLLATNIIEAGLDIPRANTMVIWRADRFGLAQLHQLRGRVGRGNRRGQVILLARSEDAIGTRTLKRLNTLATFDRLGAGFDISARDLDMRGAGDLLGETQAGHMKLIGVDLYQHLLSCALREARGEVIDLWRPELNIGASGRLPDTWIPEDDVRLSLYARLSRIAEFAELDAFEDELADRFGPLPSTTDRLMTRARIRIAARAAQIKRIDAGAASIALTPHRTFVGDPGKLGLEEKDGRYLLRAALEPSEIRDRIQAVLEALTPQ
jgi:transcription-repair coupling factor (superfamily II helicase)